MKRLPPLLRFTASGRAVHRCPAPASHPLFYADLLRREGFEVSLDEIERDRCNVYALAQNRASRSLKEPSLVLNGHIDTIPIGQSAAPATEGDWVIGRGAEDMKGGLVCMAHAASALRKAGVHSIT